MKRDAWKRLAAMEARARAAKVGRGPEAILALVMPILVAARLGGWKDVEAVASAYARALALEPRDLLAAIPCKSFPSLLIQVSSSGWRLPSLIRPFPRRVT
jgi:hypothetical protein